MDEDQDLWEKIKAAKDHLFTQTDFLQQYCSCPSLTGNSPSNHNCPLVSLPTTPTPCTTQEEKEGKNSITVGESVSSKESREPSSCYPSFSVAQSESLTSLSTIVPSALPPPGGSRLPFRLLPQSESQKSIRNTTSSLPLVKEQPVASNGK